MKLFFSLLLLTLSGNVFSQWSFSSPGRVKISLVTFYCHKETLDDLVDADGKKDEIFFSFMYTVAGINGNTKLSSKTITGVFGDATGPFRNRTSAGSAKDLFGNNQGGIQAGDVISCNIPILDIAISTGDVISIVPSIWEWDNNNFNVQLSFEEAIMAAFPLMNTKVIENIKYCYPKTEDQSCFVRNGTGFLGLPNCSTILQAVSNKPGNRPIGMTSTGSYTPIVISLGAELLEKITAMQFNNIDGRGHTNVGNLPIAFNEEALGNTRDHGNYGMYLKIEFTKTAAVQAPSPPPPPASTSGKTVILNNTINTFPAKTIKSSVSSVTGTWMGTWGYGTNDNANFLSYQLNNDGTMLLLSQVGATEAKGTFTFINNMLTMSYSYLGGGAYSASAIYDPATGKLTGTWGRNTSSTDGGKTVLTRK